MSGRYRYRPDTTVFFCFKIKVGLFVAFKINGTNRPLK